MLSLKSLKVSIVSKLFSLLSLFAFSNEIFVESIIRVMMNHHPSNTNCFESTSPDEKTYRNRTKENEKKKKIVNGVQLVCCFSFGD
jgi:hypothetical protein